MPITADVAQEKQRISEQLAKLEGERSRLQERLNELEITERVLLRFGKQTGETPRRGRSPAPRPREADGNGKASRSAATRRRAARPQDQAMPLGEATLRAVQAYPAGVSAEAVRDHIAKEFGLSVRPNHLGMALQRHRRAGLLEIRDSRWHAIR